MPARRRNTNQQAQMFRIPVTARQAAWDNKGDAARVQCARGAFQSVNEPGNVRAVIQHDPRAIQTIAAARATGQYALEQVDTIS